MDHSRHIGIFNASEWPVTLIGLGGIGAITGIALAKMGVPFIAAFDEDTVDDVNISTQFYPAWSVNVSKAQAFAYEIKQYAGDDTQVETYRQEVSISTLPEKLSNRIVISAVDSIRARQQIWLALTSAKWEWYLDARMGAEVFQLYAVRRSDWDWYTGIICQQDDKKALEEPCTQKATIFTASMAAGHIGATVRRIVTGRPVSRFLVHNIAEQYLVTP